MATGYASSVQPENVRTASGTQIQRRGIRRRVAGPAETAPPRPPIDQASAPTSEQPRRSERRTLRRAASRARPASSSQAASARSTDAEPDRGRRARSRRRRPVRSRSIETAYHGRSAVKGREREILPALRRRARAGRVRRTRKWPSQDSRSACERYECRSRRCHIAPIRRPPAVQTCIARRTRAKSSTDRSRLKVVRTARCLGMVRSGLRP